VTNAINREGGTMRFRRNAVMPLLLAFALFMGGSVAATRLVAEPIPSPTLSNNCAGCHGTFGHSAQPMPIIAGLSESYFSQVMRQFKSGDRPSTIMGRLARGYSDREIDEMAAFFATQLWVSPAQEVKPALVARGSKIHTEKCKACHKDNGRYQDAKTPRIAGQWREYLEIILQEYWRVERKMPHRFMTIILQQLKSGDLTALAHFYANQR
jgi:sulfide dehydrogenase cytochrome subunit